MQISKSIERNYVKKNQNNCQYISSNCGIDYGKPSVCHLLCLTIGLYRSDRKFKNKNWKLFQLHSNIHLKMMNLHNEWKKKINHILDKMQNSWSIEL